jgi:hypothetical protein
VDEHKTENAGVDKGNDRRGNTDYVLQAHVGARASSIGVSNPARLQDEATDAACRCKDACSTQNAGYA